MGSVTPALRSWPWPQRSPAAPSTTDLAVVRRCLNVCSSTPPAPDLGPLGTPPRPARTMITRSPGDPVAAALKRSWVLRTPRARLTTWLPEDLPELSALHADPRVSAVSTMPTSAGIRMDAVATGAAVSDGAGTPNERCKPVMRHAAPPRRSGHRNKRQHPAHERDTRCQR